MREEMLAEGYTCNGGEWTSPYTGRVTSFQPAREEYMIVREMGGIMHNSPRHWMQQIKHLEARNKTLLERSRKQGKLLARCTKVVDTARRAIMDKHNSPALDTLRNVLEEFDTEIGTEPKSVPESILPPSSLRFFLPSDVPMGGL